MAQGPYQNALRRIFQLHGEVLPPLHSLAELCACCRSRSIRMFICSPAKPFLGKDATRLKSRSAWVHLRGRCFGKSPCPSPVPLWSAGVALALMETLAEYGALELLGVQTWTTAIFRAWFGFGDLTAAARLSCLLLLVVALLMASEKLAQPQRLVAGRASKAPNAIGHSATAKPMPPPPSAPCLRCSDLSCPPLTLLWLAWRTGVERSARHRKSAPRRPHQCHARTRRYPAHLASCLAHRLRPAQWSSFSRARPARLLAGSSNTGNSAEWRSARQTRRPSRVTRIRNTRRSHRHRSHRRLRRLRPYFACGSVGTRKSRG